LICILLLTSFFYGCKTKKLTSITETKELPESHRELSKKAFDKNSNYDCLILKNFKVKYTNRGNTTTLYGAAKIIKDSLILASLRAPLGIEISRALLSPDSVKVINRSSKRVILSDYTYLNNLLNVPVDYNTVQSLLSGNLPGNNYFIATKKNPESDSISEVKDAIFIGNYFSSQTNQPLKYRAWIVPGIMKPRLLEFYRKRNLKLFEVLMGEYNRHGNNIYPGELFITHENYNGISTEIQLIINRFEEMEDTQINFQIPSKYKIIQLK
jgi:hypothetical protein